MVTEAVLFTKAPVVGVLMDGAAGATVSIVYIVAAEAVLVLPAASLAVAVKLCAPAVNRPEASDHDPLAAAVVLPSTVAPFFTRTVALASAVPLMEMEAVLFTKAPVVGVLMDGAAGATVSIVIVTEVDAEPVFPAASVALAVNA